ncbi:MAG: hypothetical protein LBS01_01700 [Prevotellaceae bacterium]|jgi:hypothetical protein|nr:hypothetical protein [Prevotellaceae bacterium]
MALFKKKSNVSSSVENLDSIAIAAALQQYFGTDNDIAAIAAALQQFFGEPHDVESNVLTIKRLRPNYETQWNAKLLGFNSLHK